MRILIQLLYLFRKYESTGAFHLNSEVEISEFPSQEFQLKHPLKLGFKTRKVGRTSPTPTSKSNRTAPCINICESCSNILFISTSVLFVANRPTPINGHVATVFVCTKYRVMRCYQLVLLTMATVNLPSPTRVWRHSQLRVPSSKVNGTHHTAGRRSRKDSRNSLCMCKT